jgi:hypothetical protein
MATKIVTKNSSTASAVPTASDLVQGELAVNVADKRLFTEDNGGSIVELGTNPSTLTVTGEITANGGIDVTGNMISDGVGIGVVPESWTYFSPIQAKRSSFAGSDGQTGVGYNWYFDGAYKYIANDYALAYQQNASSGVHSWSTAASGTADNTISWSEAMRIESGNLLVGQSSTTIPGVGNTTAGVSIRGTDGSFFSRALGSGDTNNVVSVNRSTADGNILGFQKDGTTVGSIGTANGDLNINGPVGHSGIRFQASSILPRYNGADTDGTMDIGYNDGTAIHRWRDLHLSGGVNLTNSTTTAFTQVGSNMFQLGTNSGDPTVFYTSGAERMRIDSSGNLLVGLSSKSGIATGSTADNGVYVDGSVGAVVAQSSANKNLYLSKASGYSDPDFISFQVNGASVGSIGTVSGDIRIGGLDDNHASIRFAASSKAVLPVKNSDGGLSDNTTDLGASNARFKDLHLSSGVVFGDAGGSGSTTSNTLDSYEEGTWTPVLTDLTNNATMHSLSGGVYTKIGRLVTCTANVRTTSLGSVSGGLYLSGFPFSSANTNGNNGAGSVANAENMAITAGHAITLFYGKNSNIARFDIYDHSGGVTLLQSSEWTSDGQACISVTYFTA